MIPSGMEGMVQTVKIFQEDHSCIEGCMEGSLYTLASLLFTLFSLQEKTMKCFTDRQNIWLSIAAIGVIVWTNSASPQLQPSIRYEQLSRNKGRNEAESIHQPY